MSHVRSARQFTKHLNVTRASVFCVEDREGTDIDGVEGTDSRVCALVPGEPVRMWGSLPGLESGVGLHPTPVLTRAGCAYLA